MPCLDAWCLSRRYRGCGVTGRDADRRLCAPAVTAPGRRGSRTLAARRRNGRARSAMEGSAGGMSSPRHRGDVVDVRRPPQMRLDPGRRPGARTGAPVAPEHAASRRGPRGSIGVPQTVTCEVVLRVAPWHRRADRETTTDGAPR